MLLYIRSVIHKYNTFVLPRVITENRETSVTICIRAVIHKHKNCWEAISINASVTDFDTCNRGHWLNNKDVTFVILLLVAVPLAIRAL